MISTRTFVCPMIEDLYSDGWSEYYDPYQSTTPVPHVCTRRFSKRLPSRHACTLNTEKPAVGVFIEVTQWNPGDREPTYSMEIELYAQDNHEESFKLSVYGIDADMTRAKQIVAKMIKSWEAYCDAGRN